MNYMTANILLIEAINELNNLEEGESFIVKDLFKGYLWNRVPRSERLLLGTLFLNYIKTEREHEIIPDGKNAVRQQKYTILKK